MTISYQERFKSPNSISEANNKRDDKWTKNYIVHGDAGEDETQVTTYLAANLPQTIAGLGASPLLLQSLKYHEKMRTIIGRAMLLIRHQQTQRTGPS